MAARKLLDVSRITALSWAHHPTLSSWNEITYSVRDVTV
jgi:hypothetical protein